MVWLPLLLGAVLCTLAWSAGCGDLADADVALDSTLLREDFGAAGGSIPPLACSAADATACAALPAPAGVAGWQVGCDTAAGQCYGQADVRIQQANATASASSSLDRALGKQAVRYLRSIDIAYTVPTNTLTFALARVEIFVVVDSAGGGATPVDAGSGTTVAADAVVAPTQDVLVGGLDPLGAGEIITGARHLTVASNSPAFAAAAAQVSAGRDLGLAVVVSPRVRAGAPVPAGAIEVLLQPTLRVGISWSEILP